MNNESPLSVKLKYKKVFLIQSLKLKIIMKIFIHFIKMFANFLFTQILLVIFILPLLIEIIIFIFKKDQVLTFLQVIFFSKKNHIFLII